ncbi:hypothetical protein GE107_11550 [Cohnella sp. CFH 77786]|uniref:hypothetical protein n=1 Tax=Cohnella sp. CFH 77786 TaxID=2662265 RepID=UPI001C6105ED|nr:hypothetical protein [Cohnella sp. CFH 77786]MBW5446696.1 hypothetical protein [Cohnella sp. CFH 77786]
MILARGKQGTGQSPIAENESGHPFVFEDVDQRTYLFYQGNDDRGGSWYLSKAEVKRERGEPYVV